METTNDEHKNFIKKLELEKIARLEKQKTLAAKMNTQMAMPLRNARIDGKLEGIAMTELGIATLRLQNSDSLDFHEVSVVRLHEALLAAYNAGRYDERYDR